MPATAARCAGSSRSPHRTGSTSARIRVTPIPRIAAAAPLDLPSEQVRELVRDQVASLAALAAERGARLTHVKPHGALYNQAAGDSTLAHAIALGVRDVDPTLRLVGLCRSQLLEAGLAAGLPVWGEAFVDRAYRPDGTLVPRDQPGAVHTDPGLAVTQALTLLLTGFVRASRRGHARCRCSPTRCAFMPTHPAPWPWRGGCAPRSRKKASAWATASSCDDAAPPTSEQPVTRHS